MPHRAGTARTRSQQLPPAPASLPAALLGGSTPELGSRGSKQGGACTPGAWGKAGARRKRYLERPESSLIASARIQRERGKRETGVTAAALRWDMGMGGGRGNRGGSASLVLWDGGAAAGLPARWPHPRSTHAGGHRELPSPLEVPMEPGGPGTLWISLGLSPAVPLS